MNVQQKQQGSVIMIVMIAVTSALAVIFGGLALWSFMQYREQKLDVDGKIDVAVLNAKKEQSDEDEKKFAEREKEPNRDFIGPEDYGRLTFKYPKTWSLFEATDISRGGNYNAYLSPGKVPPISEDQQFAIRVTIENKDYDRVLQSYDSRVKKGDLRSSSTSSQGNVGTRLDGNFSKNIRGAAVIYKIRDKTATIRTDADTFKPDFEKVIQSLSFQ
ncbi:hypothetical protein GX865_00675 [Candidatus Saccharibacteria bacterium]|nr:hypothetical protein [Candidatus Saccharibacteria bacterium]